jgi:hypothetical protein
VSWPDGGTGGAECRAGGGRDTEVVAGRTEACGVVPVGDSRAAHPYDRIHVGPSEGL